jgi:serine/threonine protein kinase
MPPAAIQEDIQRLGATYHFDGQEDKGANGWLFFATNRVTGATVAIKYYWWGDQPALHVEPRTLAQFNSPYIVQILSAELVGHGWARFISPRYAGDLEALVQRSRVPLHHAIDCASNVLAGLNSLHNADIVHRDLKPANILLNDRGIAAIGDFGSVARIDEVSHDVSASQHSVLYRPPESFQTGRYSKLGDLYQVGLVLYELVGGFLPKEPGAWLSLQELDQYNAIPGDFEKCAFIDAALMRRITNGTILVHASLPAYVPRGLVNVILQQASIDPTDRIQSSADFMVKLLQLKRKTVNWIATHEGARGEFDDGSVTVAVGGSGCRVEVQKRGRKPRRDSSLEANNLRACCRLVDTKLCSK